MACGSETTPPGARQNVRHFGRSRWPPSPIFQPHLMIVVHTEFPAIVRHIHHSKLFQFNPFFFLSYALETFDLPPFSFPPRIPRTLFSEYPHSTTPHRHLQKTTSDCGPSRPTSPGLLVQILSALKVLFWALRMPSNQMMP
jgi:hypothetical protein